MPDEPSTRVGRFVLFAIWTDSSIPFLPPGSLLRSFAAQMPSQQNTEPVERPRAHHLQRVPKADLVRRQDGFTQIVLKPIDDVKRTPVATSQHHRVRVGRVHLAPNIEGGLWIEESDLEIADQPEPLLREDFDSVCFKERCDSLVHCSAPRGTKHDSFDGKHA